MRNLRGWGVRFALLGLGIVVAVLILSFEAKRISAGTQPAPDMVPMSAEPAQQPDGPSNDTGETPQLD